MANQFTAVPYSCTTTMASGFIATSGANTNTNVVINSIIWNAPAAAGNVATITDASGRVLFTYTATAADVANGAVRVLLPTPIVAHDFQVTALTAGTLYIYTA